MARIHAPVRRLILGQDHVAAMCRHAELHYPEECCGILIGRAEPEQAEVQQVMTADNVAEDRRRRYDIDPRQLLDAHRQVRESGGDIVGYFHSHPASEPIPSLTDHEHAWPNASYVILGLQDGCLASIRSWRLEVTQERFEEEELTIR